MAKSRQARAREFSQKVRDEIIRRDRGKCIFCEMNYMTEGAMWIDREVKSIMHFIPRSKNGLGIPQNGAIGCQWHHEMLDNGNKGNREEMLKIFENYLKASYPEWNREELIYNKWKRE